jgi:LEA14-like dessication related protein
MRSLAARATGRRLFYICMFSLIALAGCADMFDHDAPRVTVAGVEPIEGQGFELRIDVKLRVQNPNGTPISYDGVALDLELNGKPFASGVSDQRGTVSRFSETVVNVPVTVSAFAAARQALNLSDVIQRGSVPYVVRGKLAGGAFGSVRFTDSGTIKLPGSGEGGD